MSKKKRRSCREVPLRDDFFMGIACWASAGSKNPHAASGAVAVNANGHDWVFAHDVMPGNQDIWEVDFAIHAEIEAMRRLDYTQAGTLYVTNYPCLHCVTHTVNLGIKRIVYMPLEEQDRWEDIQAFTQRHYIQLEEYKGNLHWMRDYIRYLGERGLFG